MDFQIILLPQQNYWRWVRACKEYVLKFGPLLTPEPETAVNYKAPRQIITFPNVADGYAGYGDMVKWLGLNYPGIRLDPLTVESPDDLEKRLIQRVEDDDRFGHHHLPIKMVWPTDYPVITQEFGANPHIYTRFGMPGHEGIDFRALPYTNIYCCAAGSVYQVHRSPKGHAYGIHIRIRHEGGYRTVYGHLAKALVNEGEWVEAGQVIGKADSTGASTASHLHLSLKRDDASARGETKYPKDIIDPTPYLIWPHHISKTTKQEVEWFPGKCLIGASGLTQTGMTDRDLHIVQQSKLEALKIALTESDEILAKLRLDQPGIFLMGKIAGDFSGEAVEADRFVSEVRSDFERLNHAGVQYFELLSNPNLQREGWGRSWKDGAEFAAWYLQALKHLREAGPEAKIGFPSLSLGVPVSGQRAEGMQFLEQAEEAVMASDWVGVNCYWSDLSGMQGLQGGMAYEEMRLQYPEKLLFISEFGNPATDVSQDAKGRQYLTFYRTVRDAPGIGAAFGMTLSTQDGNTSLAWRSDSEKESEIAQIIGRRTFE